MSIDVGRNIGAQVIANVEKTLRAEGREQGLVAGRLEQAARALLAVFEARHMTIPDRVLGRVDGCKDQEELERWLERAVHVRLPVDVFAEDQGAESATMTIADAMRADGYTEGRPRGRIQQAVRSLLAVFEARGIVVPDSVLRAISACDDIDRLEQLHKRAVKADSAAEIFTE